MAWNGRNESILGSKPIVVVVSSPPLPVADDDMRTDRPSPPSRDGDVIANNGGTTTTTSSSSSSSSVPPPPPPPAPPAAKNAWDGRNARIMRIVVGDDDVGDDVAALVGGDGGGTTTTISTTTTKIAAMTIATMAVVPPAAPTAGPPDGESVAHHHPPPLPPPPPVASSSSGDVGRQPRSRRRKDGHHHHEQRQQQQSQQEQQLRRLLPRATTTGEDEATESTAGSTEAGSTDAACCTDAVGPDGNDASPSSPSLEGNTVVTTATTTTAVVVVSSSSPPVPSHPPPVDAPPGRKKNNKKKGKNGKATAAGDGVAAQSGAEVPNGNGKNGRAGNNNHHKNASAAAAAAAADNANGNNGRRTGGGNHRGAGRGREGNVGNGGQQQQRQHQQQSGKGHYAIPSLRGIKATGTTDGVPDGRPICSFFARGMCYRGASCAFRHDLPVPSTTAAGVSPDGRCPVVPSPTGGACDDGVDRSTSATATSFVPTAPRRAFDPHKARAIQLAKEAQDREDRSAFFASSAKRMGDETGATDNVEEEKKAEEGRVVDPPFFSIDVECIATGYGSCARGINDGRDNAGRDGEGVPPDQYNDNSHRYPGRVAMVDSDGNVLSDILVRPPDDGAGVVSYLTPLTGLTAEICLGPDAVPLDDAIRTIRALLPPNGVVVGQAIGHDVTWLGLRAGIDFDRAVDISDIFRQRMPAVLAQAGEVVRKRAEGGGEEEHGRSSSCDSSSDEYLGFATRYRHFSLRHVCLNLLGEDIQRGVHDPATDARYSLMLFHKYRNSSPTQLRIVRDGLHRAPITPGFAAEKTPVIDGVCVSAAGYQYKRAARTIWRWYSSVNTSSAAARER